MNILPVRNPYDNTFEVVSKILNLLNVRHSKHILSKKIKDHPICDSLLSISDVLNEYQINNVSVVATVDQLGSFPVPFIAQIQGSDRSNYRFTVVKSKTDQNVEYFEMNSRKWKLISLHDFDTLWKNKIVMLVNGDDSKEEVNYWYNRISTAVETIIQVAIMAILPAIALFEIFRSIQIFELFGIKFAINNLLFLLGTALTFGLFWTEIDEDSTILKQVCQSTKKINCAAVLKSKGAKPLGISLSIWGLSYFLGCTFSLILYKPWNKELLFLLSWISVLSTAMILYSIYYQAFYLKQWCLVCLYVQGTLLAILITNIWGGWLTIDVDRIRLLSTMIVLGINIGCSLGFMCLIRYVYKVMSDNSLIKYELKKLKFDSSTFMSHLNSQLALTKPVDNVGLLLGNPDAKHQLLKVCDPYCSHCAKSHMIVRSLIGENSDINVKLIFTASTDPRDFRYFPVKHFMELSKYGDVDLLNSAIDYWYLSEDRNIKTLTKEFKSPEDITDQQPEIEKMYKWCNEMGIFATPTFFLDGKRLPDVYSIGDLRYVM